MTSDTKLPLSLQLVGVTAVLVFATSAVSAFSYVRALTAHWEALSAMPRTWSSFYYPITFLPAFYVVLTVVSAVMFALLLFARRSALVRASGVYLVVLLLALAWRIYIHFPAGGLGGLRMLSPTSWLYLGLRVGYAAWLVGLTVALLPNYSFKRTAATGLR
ncbi:MAG TPA: hypothetical protein VF132_13010 [Rudaea sp.]